jgi:hypothetical protein
MNEKVNVEPVVSRPPSLLRRISWGAIFAGLLVTMVVQFMLTLLGVGIGAATIDPLKDQNPAQGLGVGSAIWLIVSALISVFIGSCIAGRLSGAPRRADGLLHGVVTWSAATLFTLFLLFSATGMVLGGVGSLLSGVVKTGGAAAAGASGSGGGMSQDMMASLQQKAKQIPGADALLPPTGRDNGQTSPPGELTQMAQKNKELAAALARMEKNGGAAKSPKDRDQVVQILTSQENMDQQRATELVTQWDSQTQQLKQQTEQKARQAGDVAAKGISKGALWGFAALLLELGVAAWGGWAGAASIARMRTAEPTTAAA